jgi:hypothetical protein
MGVSGRFPGENQRIRRINSRKHSPAFLSKNPALRIRVWKETEIWENTCFKILSRKMMGKGKILGETPGAQTKISHLRCLASPPVT